MGVVARGALHEHEPGRGREPVLARVVRERDPRVGFDPVELSPEPERGRERDRPRLPVPQADRRDRRHHGAAGRGQVRERGRQVPADDLVIGIGPQASVIALARALQTRTGDRRRRAHDARTPVLTGAGLADRAPAGTRVAVSAIPAVSSSAIPGPTMYHGNGVKSRPFSVAASRTLAT